MNSCSKAPVKPKVEEKPSAPVEQKLLSARQSLEKKDYSKALKVIDELRDAELSGLDQSIKYNFKGIVFFMMGKWELSLSNFQNALKLVPKETVVEAQVWLNIASVYFKQGSYLELKHSLEKIDYKILNPYEISKYGQLLLAWSIKANDRTTMLTAMILTMQNISQVSDIKNNRFYFKLIEVYEEYQGDSFQKILSQFENQKNSALAFLVQKNVEKLFTMGKLEEAQTQVEYLEDYFKEDNEVQKFLVEFNTRIGKGAALNRQSIGVLLPLTGEKGAYGSKTLLGIEAALKLHYAEKNIELVTKDAMNSVSQSVQGVRELVQEKQVAMIIGGLFPEAAKAEYEEAKKWGVLYISLSPLSSPRTEKNELLIEIPGSIESQIRTLTSPLVLEKFGKKLGVIYPDGEAGEAYLDEFWQASEMGKVELRALASYPKGSMDFRAPLRKFLGLEFTRERREEKTLFDQMYALERTSIRRIQSLPPVIDFDFVFTSALPHEALSLVPTLGYFDAKDVVIFGGPSWASKTLVKEQKNLGKIYFIGDHPQKLNKEFYLDFQKQHQRIPSLIENLGYEAGLLAFQIQSEINASDRYEFRRSLLKPQAWKNASGEWGLDENLWLKKMHALMIKNGSIETL